MTGLIIYNVNDLYVDGKKVTFTVVEAHIPSLRLNFL